MSQPSGPGAEFVRNCENELAGHIRALKAITDPRERAHAAAQLLACVRRQDQRVAELRNQALMALAQRGASYAQLARLSGLTRGRIAQLAHSAGPPR